MPAERPPASRAATAWSRIGHAVRWLAPGLGLLMIPKCPACLAAYVALATGVAVSLPIAAALRSGLFVLCVAALSWLAFTRIRRLRLNAAVAGRRLFPKRD